MDTFTLHETGTGQTGSFTVNRSHGFYHSFSGTRRYGGTVDGYAGGSTISGQQTGTFSLKAGNPYVPPGTMGMTTGGGLVHTTGGRQGQGGGGSGGGGGNDYGTGGGAVGTNRVTRSIDEIDPETVEDEIAASSTGGDFDVGDHGDVGEPSSTGGDFGGDAGGPNSSGPSAGGPTVSPSADDGTQGTFQEPGHIQMDMTGNSVSLKGVIVEEQGLVGAFFEGLDDGRIIVADRLTAGQIDHVHQRAEQLIAQNGGLYRGSAIAGDVAREALVAAATGAGMGLAAKGAGNLAAAVGKKVALSNGAACAVGTTAQAAAVSAQIGFAGKQAYDVGIAAASAYDAYERGDYEGMTRALASAGIQGIGLTSSAKDLAKMAKDMGRVGFINFFKKCFAAGTPLLTPDGSKPIERFQSNDLILSRPEENPEAPVEVKVVEAVFVRRGSSILKLRVGGRTIATTDEHPFYVRDKGWLEARELQFGDLLSSHDGQWRPVEEVRATGEFETVYNLRIADLHTYFVGSLSWGFSVWAHNAGGNYENAAGGGNDSAQAQDAPKKIQVDATKAPGSAQHLEDAGVVGRSLTVNRPGSPQNRADALRGRRKVPGHDLDEAPPAVLRQPGDPVSVKPVPSGDNRSGGAQIGNQMRDVPNGAQIIIEIINKIKKGG